MRHLRFISVSASKTVLYKSTAPQTWNPTHKTQGMMKEEYFCSTNDGTAPSKIFIVGEIRTIRYRCQGYTTISYTHLSKRVKNLLPINMILLMCERWLLSMFTFPFDSYFTIFLVEVCFFSGGSILMVFTISPRRLKLIVLIAKMARCREKAIKY